MPVYICKRTENISRQTFLYKYCWLFYSLLFVAQSFSMSDSLQPHGLQHIKLPWPLLTPRVCSSKLHWVDDVVKPPHQGPLFLFYSILTSIGVFSMRCLFSSGGQSTRASASFLLIKSQGWFPLGLIGLMSLLSKELSRVFISSKDWKHQTLSTQPSLWSKSNILTWLLEKNKALTIRPLSTKLCRCFLICCLGLS